MRDADERTRLPKALGREASDRNRPPNRARNDAELDARMAQAIDAWRELGPEGTGEAPEDLLARDEGFLDRVMAAEVARAKPRVINLPVDAAEAATGSTRRSRLRLRVAGLGVAAAGLLVVLAVGGPWGERVVEPASPAEVEPPTALGSVVAGGGLEVPELAAEGTPGLPVPDDLGPRIEAYIADYGRNYGPTFKFHGVVLVARSGRVLYQQGFGAADSRSGAPNTMHTRFRLGLLTEPFTATAVLQLRDAGLLRLDDTIDRWVPELPRSNQITVRDLLSHRSGIPNYTDSPSFPVWKAQYHHTDEMVERLAKLPLEFSPGSATAPSNSNYYLLGVILERITGSGYGEHMAEYVLGPAGMTQTGFGDAWDTGEQAQGNVWSEEETLEPPAPIDMSTFGAAGGLVSSPADLVAFDRALRAGEVLSPDSLDEMITPSEDGYGYGWLVTRAYGQSLLSFPGAIDGYSGSVLRFLDDETLVVVLANTEVVPGAQVAQDVAMIVYGDEPPKRNEPAEVSIAPVTYYKYVGTYGISAQTRETYADAVPAESFDLLGTVHVEKEGDRLYFNVPGHARTWMHPMGRNRFFFKDHTGNKVSFELGADNRATRVVVHYQGARFLLDRLAMPLVGSAGAR
jgi:CubicO group peptidase (beta-lactamase class C family)